MRQRHKKRQTGQGDALRGGILEAGKGDQGEDEATTPGEDTRLGDNGCIYGVGL